MQITPDNVICGCCPTKWGFPFWANVAVGAITNMAATANVTIKYVLKYLLFIKIFHENLYINIEYKLFPISRIED